MNKAESYSLMETTEFAKLSYVKNLEMKSKINRDERTLNVNFS